MPTKKSKPANSAASSAQAKSAAKSLHWLSQDYGELVREVVDGSAPVFDVLIVGSGYGGAIAAATLAGKASKKSDGTPAKPLSVCVLERGKEFLPGTFPARMPELATQFRYCNAESAEAQRERTGLFDMRLDGDVAAVLANGLGGGSLINAGVMEVPQDSVFNARWPRAVRADLLAGSGKNYYQRARTLVGADTTIADHAQHRKDPLKKYLALQRLAQGGTRPEPFRDSAVSIAMQDKNTAAGVKLSACKLCGDCASGCNYNAKESLDTNLLVQARQRGARIYTGGTVLRVERESHEAPWTIYTTPTAKALSKRQGGPVEIRAKRVILAAGAYGSTEILLRSQQASTHLNFSSMLGQRFSGNGDMLAVGFDQKHPVNSVADENQPPAERRVGPTNTGIIDVELSEFGADKFSGKLTVEELNIPGPLRRLFAETFTTANTLYGLGESDTSKHEAGLPKLDPFAVSKTGLNNSQIFAVMGDDGADGQLQLKPQADTVLSDGALHVHWPEVSKHPLFSAQIQALEARCNAAGVGGRVIANPGWRPLPRNMEFLLYGARGPLLTVHPLGGCPMGDGIQNGAVNQLGQVYDANQAAVNPVDDADTGVHADLVVLDGAIIPTALATNPALTIAAVALRAVETLCDVWGLVETPVVSESAQRYRGMRPLVRDVEQEIIDRNATQSAPETATVGAFKERLVGEIKLKDDAGEPATYVAELTLDYEPKPILALVSNGADAHNPRGRPLQVTAGPASRLRLFKPDDWERIRREQPRPEDREKALESNALGSAQVEGTLYILARGATGVWGRRCNGLKAWLPNRGARDSWKALEDAWIRRGIPEEKGPSPWERTKGGWNIASHAGEVRLFDYDLTLTHAQIKTSSLSWPVAEDGRYGQYRLRGVKTLTYQRPSNPWRQLQEMQVTEFPGLVDSKASVLKLDHSYMASQDTPLFRLIGQADQANALADLASVAAYFMRMVLSIHIWNMPLPDAPMPVKPKRLPGRLAGLPLPEIRKLQVDNRNGAPVYARLTRYPNPDSQAPPLMLFHGYSTSGTTFAHPALKPSAAEYFWRQGRDVWVVDLRISSGMPDATVPWTFEAVALKDVPLAVDTVVKATGQPKVDVIAHCMSAAIFSMAVLSADNEAEDIVTAAEREYTDAFEDSFRAERGCLPQRINRMVLSQIGPLMVFTPANIFRAYLTRYAENFFTGVDYKFRPADAPGLAEQVFDRLIASQPYSDDEYRLEHPALPWRQVRYAGTRHRMDALYGQTFELGNMGKEVLRHIDDFFGPLNLRTITQAAHFARAQSLTNRYGRNCFVSRDSLEKHWRFPTLSVHGRDNGLADVATLKRMQQIFADAGCDYTTLEFPSADRPHNKNSRMGHQDSWLGKHAVQMFAEIEAFLAQPEQPQARDASQPRAHTRAEFSDAPLLAQVPQAGPVLGYQGLQPIIPVTLGTNPVLGQPYYLAYFAVSGIDTPSERQMGQGVTLRSLAEEKRQWLPLNIAEDVFDPAYEGVLCVLIYDQSAQLPAPSFDEKVLYPSDPFMKSDQFRGDPDAVFRALAAVEKYLDEAEPATLRRGLVTPPSGVVRARMRSADATQTPQTPPAFSLALGSCQYPHGLIDKAPAYAAYRQLAARLDAPDNAILPQALILAGDQIYADMSAGIFDANLLDERYVGAYERFYRQPEVRDVLRRLPTLTMLDDHEIDDGWAPLVKQQADPAHSSLDSVFDSEAVRYNEAMLREGRANYMRYQRGPEFAAPPLDRVPKSLWYSVEYAAGPQHKIPIFMADTRTERDHRVAASLGQACIMGGHYYRERPKDQFQALEDWLLQQHPDSPKVIVSPSMVLPRHRYALSAFPEHDAKPPYASTALFSDAWDGYPASLYRLLAFIADHRIKNVVFLSGDEHMGLACRAELFAGQRHDKGESDDYNDPVVIHSIHTGALYSPYPFANARKDHFVAQESFEFLPPQGAEHEGYRCRVTQTEMFPGSGFTLLRFSQAPEGNWQLEGEFMRLNTEQPAHRVWNLT